MKKNARKFYIQLTDGTTFEIGELDFNNIDGRIRKGSVAGWYRQRDLDFDEGAKHDWKLNFKDIALVYSDKPEIKDRVIRGPEKIDINKRKSKTVGADDPPKPKKGCAHDWNNPEHWEYVSCFVGGVQRYHKQCHECGGRSTLIKKREVEVNMEKRGQKLDDVPLVDSQP
jgi:hypothetical protein